MPAKYDLTGHPQLSEDVTDQGAEYLDWQTRLAEAVLGIDGDDHPFETPYLERVQDALVLQVNWQEETGVDARMLTTATRAGVTFRTEKGTGLMPLADPMALRVYAAALDAWVAEFGEASSGRAAGWDTLRSLR